MFDAVALDLETLGTDPGDAILSIGMVEFNTATGEQGAEFFCSFDEGEWLRAGYTFRQSTKEWWAKPGLEDARRFLTVSQMGMAEGLEAAYQWLARRDLGGGLWSRGYMDETMLKLAIRRELGIEDPWHYRAASDARTLLRSIETIDPVGHYFGYQDIEFVGTPHHALHDAQHEAKLVVAALKGLEVCMSVKDEYHRDAMRTAAGPEVLHLPADPETRRDYEVDFLSNLMAFLVAAARLDKHKSQLFYNKDKFARDYRDFLSELLPVGVTTFRLQRNGLNPQLIHAILGLATESAELVEDLIKLCGGTAAMAELRPNMSRETGDIDWYQELFAEAIDVSVDQSRRENIARLRKRFPDKFTEADAVERKDEAPTG